MGYISRVYRENKDTVILLVIPIAIIAKLIEHLILPGKYFYDSTRMLQQSLNADFEGGWDGSYEITADIFRKLNIFNFTTLLEWSILVGVIFNIILIIVFFGIKELDFAQSIFCLMCIGLCNIYVFNLGKDIIQYTLFAICFAIIVMDRVPSWIKIIGCALVFCWESTFFRSYYIIMAAFSVAIYLIFSFVRKKYIKFNLKKIFFVILILYLLMYIFLAISQVIMPEEYQEIMVCKDSSTQLGAASVIKDNIEHNGNINLFMQNYIINSIRMLFPIELVKGGIFYVPFLAFQVFLLFYMYKNLKNIYWISEKNVLALSVFIAFFMGSVLFEPDFGSFARHEAAAFPIIILFALDNATIVGKDPMRVTDRKEVSYE